MKFPFAAALLLLMASCAATPHHTATAANLVADDSPAKTEKADVTGGPVGPVTEMTPDDLLRLLRGEDDATPPPAPDCDDTPFCVVYHRFNGVVNKDSVKPAIAAVKSAKPDQILMLEINTNGGSLWDGFELERALEGTKAKVFCVVDGNALSMGFFMLQSCQNRVMTKRSELMAHEVLEMHEGPITLRDARRMIEDMEATTRGIAEHAIRRSKLTYDQYQAKVQDKEWFMTWVDALNAGMVDCVYNGNASEALDELQNTGSLTCAK